MVSNIRKSFIFKIKIVITSCNAATRSSVITVYCNATKRSSECVYCNVTTRSSECVYTAILPPDLVNVFILQCYQQGFFYLSSPEGAARPFYQLALPCVILLTDGPTWDRLKRTLEFIAWMIASRSPGNRSRSSLSCCKKNDDELVFQPWLAEIHPCYWSGLLQRD